MAIEEEFAVEIPDAEADEITSISQGESTSNPKLDCFLMLSAIEYIAKVCDNDVQGVSQLIMFFRAPDRLQRVSCPSPPKPAKS